MRAAAAELHNAHCLPSPLARPVSDSSWPLFSLFSSGVRKIQIFRGAAGSTDKRGHVAHGSPAHVAIGKDEAITLPRMGGTDANIMRITGGNFPTRRHVNRLRAISNTSVIVNFVRVKRHIHVGAIALQGGGGEKSV